MNWDLLKLGTVEVWRSMGFGPKVSGGTDFRILTAVYAALTIILLVALTIADTGPYRVNQVLLGALSADKTPIRVTAKPTRTEAIDTYAMEQFNGDDGLARLGLTLYPMRMIDLSLPPLQLVFYQPRIDDGATSGYSSGQGQIDSIWRGEELVSSAIPVDDPIWGWAVDNSTSPETRLGARFENIVIANLANFRELFDYEAYRRKLLGLGDSGLIKNYLPDLKNGDIGSLPHILLNVRERASGNAVSNLSFHPFRIIWVEGIPLPEPVSLIVPLSTYDLIVQSDLRPLSAMALEAKGKPAVRISRVSCDKGTDEAGSECATFDAFTECLGAGSKNVKIFENEFSSAIYRTDSAGNPYPFQKSIVDLCLIKSGSQTARFDFTDDLIGHSYDFVSTGKFTTTCNTRSSADKKMSELFKEKLGEADECAAGGTEGPIFAERYRKANIYVDGALDLSQAVTAIENWEAFEGRLGGGADAATDQVFVIDQTYSKSLVRFEILERITRGFSYPLMLLVGGLLLFFVISKQKSILEIRRREHGFWLLNGVSARSVGWMVMAQGLICALIGAALGVIIGEVLLWGVNKVFWPVDQRVKAFQILGFNEENLLETIRWQLKLLFYLTVSIAFSSLITLAAILTSKPSLFGVNRSTPVDFVMK